MQTHSCVLTVTRRWTSSQTQSSSVLIVFVSDAVSTSSTLLQRVRLAMSCALLQHVRLAMPCIHILRWPLLARPRLLSMAQALEHHQIQLQLVSAHVSRARRVNTTGIFLTSFTYPKDDNARWWHSLNSPTPASDSFLDSPDEVQSRS